MILDHNYWRRSPLVNLNKQPMYSPYEDKMLDKLLMEKFLTVLTDKERETILLWSHGNTMKDIALAISVKYEGRTPDNPLGGRAMSARIKKILNKLRKYAKESEIS